MLRDRYDPTVVRQLPDQIFGPQLRMHHLPNQAVYPVMFDNVRYARRDA
jgi:hypothetical protein